MTGSGCWRQMSPAGIRFAMRFGVTNKDHLTEEVMRGYTDPFVTQQARDGLVRGGRGLSMRGFREIAKLLPSFDRPVRAIYGTEDRILPDVAQTMERLRGDLPMTEVIPVPGCGHFLQEDAPEQVGELIAEFLEADLPRR